MRAMGIAALACVLMACAPPHTPSGQAGEDAVDGGTMQSSIQPGQYRTTITILEMNIPGVPSQGINMQPTTTENCVTSSDISEFTRPNMVDPDSAETCTQNNMRSSGGHIEGDSTCTGPHGTRTMHMNGNYTSNHVEMEISSTGELPGGRGQMSQRMRMVTDRIGDCAAGENAQ